MSTKPASYKNSSHSTGLTLQSVRDGVVDEIAEALKRDEPELIDALPGTGKSRGVVEAANRLDIQIVVFTCRGRKEQYEQYEDWCADLGLSSFVLPSVYEDCPTVKQGHEEAENLLNKGVPPSRVHNRLSLPCEKDGVCEYRKKRQEDLSEYDVLLGHYSHAQVDEYLQNRVAVFDEFPGDVYLTEISSEDISAYLQKHQLPFNHFIDLIQDRDDCQIKRKAYSAMQTLDARDESLPFGQTKGHVLSGLGVLTLLNGNDLGNGWEESLLGRGQVGLFDTEKNDIYVHNPPDLPDNVVALDGTPTKVMWEIALGLYDRKGQSLNRQQVLSETERKEYVREVQNLEVVQVTDDDKPYSSGNYVNEERDSALVSAVGRKHGGNVGVISSRAALQKVKTNNHPTRHYGNILGSNKLSGVDAGVVQGSPHYGNDYIQKWGALAGIEVPPKRNNSGSYGEFGDKIHSHMHDEVVQAVFRFSRHGDGATVYVDTGVLPDWIPTVAGPSTVDISTWSVGQRQVIQALRQLGNARTKEIAKQTTKTARHVRNVLEQLRQRDFIISLPAEDGRGGARKHIDIELSSRNESGPVDLPCLISSARRTRFSEQTPNNTSKGAVPKNSFEQMYWDEMREAHREAMCREERYRRHCNIEKVRS